MQVKKMRGQQKRRKSERAKEAGRIRRAVQLSRGGGGRVE